jgi:hypothetical protein
LVLDKQRSGRRTQSPPVQPSHAVPLAAPAGGSIRCVMDSFCGILLNEAVVEGKAAWGIENGYKIMEPGVPVCGRRR